MWFLSSDVPHPEWGDWHVKHRHADLPIRESRGPVNDDELEAIVQNEITAQISDLNSPLNVAIDERVAGVLAEVKVIMADSDRFLREHVEHRIEERLGAITAIRREPTKVKDESDPLAPYLRERKTDRPVKVAEMNADFQTTFTGCSLHHRHKRSIGPRYSTKPMKIATDEMVRDALEYCGIAV